MKKPRFILVREVPIFFYMKSCTTQLRSVNGFKVFRVAGPFSSSYFYVCGNNYWIVKP